MPQLPVARQGGASAHSRSLLQLKRQDLNIAALELETDPIDLDPRSLGQRQPKLKRFSGWCTFGFNRNISTKLYSHRN